MCLYPNALARLPPSADKGEPTLPPQQQNNHLYPYRYLFRIQPHTTPQQPVKRNSISFPKQNRSAQYDRTRSLRTLYPHAHFLSTPPYKSHPTPHSLCSFSHNTHFQPYSNLLKELTIKGGII